MRLSLHGTTNQRENMSERFQKLETVTVTSQVYRGVYIAIMRVSFSLLDLKM